MPRLRVIVACLMLALSASAALAATKPPVMEFHLQPDLSFALYKPPGWQVTAQPSGERVGIAVTDPSGGASASMRWLPVQGKADAVQVVAAQLQELRKRSGDASVDWVRTTADRRRAVAEVRFAKPRGAAFRARYYVNADATRTSVYVIEAPASDFARMQPTLLTVLGNVTLLNQASLEQARARIQATSGAPAPAAAPPMSQRRLPDGSASMLVPEGWALQGGKGSVLSTSPATDSGFSFASAEFWAQSRLPYFDGSAIPAARRHPYVRPIDALTAAMRQVGSSDFVVERRWQDAARAREASAALNRTVEMEGAVLRYRTARGVATRAFFEAFTLAPLPSGQWMVVFWGVWAPADRFEQQLPTLAKMAGSFSINDAWAANYVQQGLARLREQMQRTQAAMRDTAATVRESSMAAFQERMRSGDYIDYKRTSTIRGEQEWLSEVEGGVLYKSDRWGLSREGERVAEGQPFNYYNYQGDNPRYAERMTPVDATREVYERVYRP